MKHFRTHTHIAFLPGRSMVMSPDDAKSFAADKPKVLKVN
jgi:hypothetical protein